MRSPHASDPRPSDEQKAAVATALGRQLGIISGGPGTGKTTTVLALVRTLVRLGIPPEGIALCAPTGKAAGRLADDFRTRLVRSGIPPPPTARYLADSPKAQTLHRLLGLSRRSSGAQARDPLPFRAVIIDESSMVDLVLMDKLLTALLDDTLLVLLGDADQLPSISAGAVFRDLGPLAVRLERGFRADIEQPEGKQLTLLASAVRAGQAERAINLCTLRPSCDDLTWQGVEHLAHEQRDDLLRHYHQRVFGRADIAALFHHVYQEVDGGFAEEKPGRLGCLSAASRAHTHSRRHSAELDRRRPLQFLPAQFTWRWTGVPAR
jgi:exodeoxyribonuclease V alpha subunit